MNKSRAFLAASLVAAVGVTAVPAVAQSPSRIAVSAVGSEKLIPNRSYQQNYRWNRDSYTVRPGGTIVLRNLIRGEEPHTFSIVRRSDQPKRIADAGKCFPPTGACGKIFAAHQFPEEEGPPKVILADGGDGFNKPYDSIVISPRGQRGSSANLRVTAPHGTNLYALCALHPQMQTVVRVRRR